MNILSQAEDFIAAQSVGYSMTSGFEMLTRLDDVAGEPCWHMEAEGDSYNGGIAEAADFIVNTLGWNPDDYPQP